MGKEYNFKICEVGFLAQIFMRLRKLQSLQIRHME